MLSTTLLKLALAAPLALAAWGDYCTTNLNAGDASSRFYGRSLPAPQLTTQASAYGRRSATGRMV